MSYNQITKKVRQYLGRIGLAGLSFLACAKENPNNTIIYEESINLPKDLVEKLSCGSKSLFNEDTLTPIIEKNVLKNEGLCRLQFYSHETNAPWAYSTDPRTEVLLTFPKARRALKVFDQDMIDTDDSNHPIYTNPDGFPNVVDVIECKDPNVKLSDMLKGDNCLPTRRYSAFDPSVRWCRVHDPRDGELALAGQYLLKFAKQRVMQKTNWRPRQDTEKVLYSPNSKEVN